MKKTAKGLSVFSLTMMALGSVIGGSFFLGSAISLKNAGPSIVLAYILAGIIICFILFALSELTVADPTPGSFQKFARREFGKGMGFIIGWIYWTGLVLALSSEAVAVSTFIKIWFPNLAIPIIGLVIIVLVTIINLLGTEKLSFLESCLAVIKVLTIFGFIVFAYLLIFGNQIDLVDIKNQAFMPNGFKGLSGSMLIVIFTYAGFEIIGLAASETANPNKVIPKAILSTIIILISLYTLSSLAIILLIPTNEITANISPLVAAFDYHNITWFGKVINFIMVSAILSTMLAATFSLARMLRALAIDGFAPSFLKDIGDIPYRGIIFSGSAILVFFSLSFVLPEQIYIFLVSSSGFTFLFIYLIILLTHKKFRKKTGCPQKGSCQLPFYPYSSWISIIGLVLFMISMPFVKGQGSGLLAGVTLVLFYIFIYFLVRKKI